MTELITIGEKGQIVIPKKFRDDLKLHKGARILATEENNKIILNPVKLDEKHLMMLLSESTLKKVWNNKYDDRWDDVL